MIKFWQLIVPRRPPGLLRFMEMAGEWHVGVLILWVIVLSVRRNDPRCLGENKSVRGNAAYVLHRLTVARR